MDEINNQEIPLITSDLKLNSTFKSTFNSINILIGMSLLSLPFAFSLSGWFFSIFLLLFFAFTTNFTAKIMGKCAEKLEFVNSNYELISYSSIVEFAWGIKGKYFLTSVLILELFTANIAMLTIAADSIESLGLKNLVFIKIFISILLLPLTILKNTRFLVYTSLLGIVACLNIVAVICFEGFISDDIPGSWKYPSKTKLWPSDIKSISMALGLLLVGFDGLYYFYFYRPCHISFN